MYISIYFCIILFVWWNLVGKVMIIIILSKVGQGTKLDIVQKVSETSRIKLVIYELIFHFLVSFFLLPYHCSSIFCISSSLFEPTNQHLQASSCSSFIFHQLISSSSSSGRRQQQQQQWRQQRKQRWRQVDRELRWEAIIFDVCR